MNKHLSISASAEDRYDSTGAVSIDDRVFVSGVTGAGDTADAQFRDAVARAEDALGELDCAKEDVVGTRVFCTDPSDHDALGRAHGG